MATVEVASNETSEQFHLNYPPQRLVVETNLGEAGYIGQNWFKWWSEIGEGCFARIAHKGDVL
jgi:hypothetical protein